MLPPVPATCGPSPYLCLLEEDSPATSPVTVIELAQGPARGSQGSIGRRGSHTNNNKRVCSDVVLV
ncbi:hypothetical protein E2C01_078726 [Portunus trituberculatus]|uniref:Uncharacterized protein n=1 Tax=Portunus trituberculatus TaxID=210409 RepID=A0A5B7IF36_PORTR|nr:hypothetical protein [Portunus trituberculatus]